MTRDKNETSNMAVFCDFENIAIGVQHLELPKFNIDLVLERLLVLGNIIVKRAYCDWERYRAFKSDMHEASFELIEIPHVRMSGKNSADIRMVVDAMDLCYTKSNIDTFVIISGDSDFSPLVSKLRENGKLVIGVGVRADTAELLVSNCDTFLFYEDLDGAQKRGRGKTEPLPPKSSAPDSKARKPHGTEEERRQEAMQLVLSVLTAMTETRDDNDPIWGSMIKQTLRRQKPGFNESDYGFRSFKDLLNEMERQKMVNLERQEHTGAAIVRLAQ